MNIFSQSLSNCWLLWMTPFVFVNNISYCTNKRTKTKHFNSKICLVHAWDHCVKNIETNPTFEVHCRSLSVDNGHIVKDKRGENLNQTKLAVYFSCPATKAMVTHSLSSQHISLLPVSSYQQCSQVCAPRVYLCRWILEMSAEVENISGCLTLDQLAN